MTITSAHPFPPPPPRSSPRHPHRRLVVIIVGLLAALLVAVVAFIVVAVVQYGRAPSFPSLTSHPDRSLHGTIAYVSQDDQPCLRVTLASGAAARELQCFDRSTEGWPSELAWLDDGRLRATALEEVPYRAVRWQRIYDVRTGAVVEVPPSEVVDTAPPGASSRLSEKMGLGTNDSTAVNAAGEQVTVRSSDGHVELVLSGPGGEHTLLSVDGGGGYAMNGPAWSPDQKWVLVHDSAGRLLLTTIDEPSTTRVLAHQHGEELAITGADLLAER